MAYLDLCLLPVLAPARAATPPSLTPLERTVLRIAGTDRLRSLAAPSRAGRLATRLFGWRRSARLACPRLEALRRLAVLTRHGWTPSAAELRALGEAGLSPATMAAVRLEVPAPRRATLRGRLTLAAEPLAHLGVAWLEDGVAGVAGLLALPLLRRVVA